MRSLTTWELYRWNSYPLDARVTHLPTGATDPQTGEAGGTDGSPEPTRKARPAELSMGRNTNSRLNRRQVLQAYVGYWLDPKRTWRQERVTLSLWLDNLLLVQIASQRAPGEQ